MVLVATEQNGLPSPTSTSMSLRFDFEQPETSMKKLRISDISNGVDNARQLLKHLLLVSLVNRQRAIAHYKKRIICARVMIDGS